MDRKHFRGILRKYRKSRATPEEEKVVDSWYYNMGKGREPSIEREDDPTLEKKYWSAIHSHISYNRQQRLIPWVSIGIAASLLFSIVTALYLISPRTSRENQLAEKEPMAGEWQQIFNKKEVSRRIVLEDGSTVTLEPRSHLKFPSIFNDDERAIYLEGEALFEVAHDSKRPFLVYTAQLTTRVLGTSFRVTAFEEEANVTVSVNTGKVSVVTHAEAGESQPVAREVILTPNQQIVFDKEQNKLSRMIVDEPQPVIPAEEVRQMRFEAAPVPEIFEAIEKVYGVDLVFDNDKLSTCTLTSVISDGTLYKRLDIICKAIGATYALRENQIIITSTGCNFQ